MLSGDFPDGHSDSGDLLRLSADGLPAGRKGRDGSGQRVRQDGSCHPEDRQQDLRGCEPGDGMLDESYGLYCTGSGRL